MEENKEINESEKVEKKGNKKLWVVISVIFVVCVVGVITIFAVPYIREQQRLEERIFQEQMNAEINAGAIRGYFKPIIYLYPEETTQLTVKLGNPQKLTCSYPQYTTGWNVVAEPDGTLTDVETGRKLYSLYWEGINSNESEMKEGFVVKGSEAISFLEEKLEILGLNYREAEEFIVYWLPKLQANEWNYIRFETMEEINENMPLTFSVEPDSLIRVMMEFKGLEEYVEIPEQKLETSNRTGFVVVEWGGTELK